MSQNYTYPPGFATSVNPSVGTNGSPAPVSSTQVAGKDPSNNLAALLVDSSGNLKVAVENTTGVPVNTSDSADGPVTPGTVASKSILIGLQFNTSLPTLSNTQQASAQADSSGRLIISPLTNSSVVKAQLQDNSGTAITLGQKTMSASLPVAIASDQSTLNVLQPDTLTSGSITSTQSVTLAVNGLGTVGIQVSGTWSGTLFVEASVDGTTFNSTTAVTLATGAPTLTIAANGVFQMQASGMNSVRIRGNTVASGTANITLRGNQSVASVMLDNSLPTGANVIGAVTQSGNWSTRTQDGSGNNITSTSNALDVNLKTSSITLPISGTVTANQGTANATPWNQNIAQFGGSSVVTGTGASGSGIPRVTISNDSSLAANQSVNMNQVGGSSVTLGQKTSANSIPVVVASDQSTISTTSLAKGNTPLQFVRNDYTVTNVTTAAYVQLIASTSGITNVLEIFDSSGQTLKIAFGGSGSEVDQFIVYPGGNGRITCTIASGTRISIRAISGTANAGEFDMNLYT